MNMRVKPNYIVIPFIGVVVAILGGLFSSMGMGWYDNELIKPVFTPSDLGFLIVWAVIFVLTIISVLITWNKRFVENRFLLLFRKKEIDVIFTFVIGLFVANAIFDILWTLLFFTLHQISLALFEMIILEITILIIIGLLWKRSKLSSLLLIPYAGWIAFLTYLTLQIVFLN